MEKTRGIRKHDVKEGRILAGVQWSSNSSPRVSVSVKDSAGIFSNTIALIQRKAYYDATTGDLFSSSIQEQSPSGSKSYSYDESGRLIAFSVLDRETWIMMRFAFSESSGPQRLIFAVARRTVSL